jgi:hypothetical protein
MRYIVLLNDGGADREQNDGRPENNKDKVRQKTKKDRQEIPHSYNKALKDVADRHRRGSSHTFRLDIAPFLKQGFFV